MHKLLCCQWGWISPFLSGTVSGVPQGGEGTCSQIVSSGSAGRHSLWAVVDMPMCLAHLPPARHLQSRLGRAHRGEPAENEPPRLQYQLFSLVDSNLTDGSLGDNHSCMTRVPPGEMKIIRRQECRCPLYMITDSDILFYSDSKAFRFYFYLHLLDKWVNQTLRESGVFSLYLVQRKSF